VSTREAFLAGERPDDVAIYLADAHLDNPGALAERAERVEDGFVLVLDGQQGRELFPQIAGQGAMEFAQAATANEGQVAADLTGATCPDDDGSDDHVLRFVLAFAQEQTEDVGGPYESGDVIHAYAQCACGMAYSDRWVVSDRSDA